LPLELQITESGPKPTKLKGDGKKKIEYVVKATATLILDDQAYKVIVSVVGPDKDGADELFGTAKLGDSLDAEFTPDSPE
jgi:hypothetical protein